jgi:hypothetical protein
MMMSNGKITKHSAWTSSTLFGGKWKGFNCNRSFFSPMFFGGFAQGLMPEVNELLARKKS